MWGQCSPFVILVINCNTHFIDQSHLSWTHYAAMESFTITKVQNIRRLMNIFNLYRIKMLILCENCEVRDDPMLTPSEDQISCQVITQHPCTQRSNTSTIWLWTDFNAQCYWTSDAPLEIEHYCWRANTRKIMPPWCTIIIWVQT